MSDDAGVHGQPKRQTGSSSARWDVAGRGSEGAAAELLLGAQAATKPPPGKLCYDGRRKVAAVDPHWTASLSASSLTSQVTAVGGRPEPPNDGCGSGSARG